ncbi:acyltransferase family protein [Mucilaginibacter sp. L3T2-6]|uniref:acyltransferase family protein n=1 Tax=Mucilaginibacter sp. L3T2-6 TaxID=3062491 RepID=UPI002676B6C2|nr:acyltransferase family protein [Mucilaginibacter sp. L3T2-6]MDO3641708.1 acyltransferase family protein [Mucilaginibacter sp. L3T2-6]MDV6214202.1 acyltransferase family protein [Mucilaginibacter sp. L3T2-6]
METIQRQTYLDWLRIISIAGVLFFHSAMPYTAYDWWHIKNKETSHLVMEVVFFMHLVRMPLLFFISGTVSYYMMQRRSSLNFIGLRFRRLFIPLLVGMFIIVPPQIYMERLNNGFRGSVWDFYKTTFSFIPYPKGNFSWHHLWFIAYLFLYDLLLAPLFAWMVSPKSENFKAKLAVLAKDKWVYILTLPSIVWYALLSNKHPETGDLVHDWCYFVYWLFFLLAGFICIIQPKLMNSLEHNRRFALTIGFLGLLLVNYMRWNKFDPFYSGRPDDLSVILSTALRPVIAWGWLLALVGYGKKYLNRPHRSLNYLNQAVYPFYIVHQTVIVCISYYIVELQDDILSKYLFTVVVTFFITTGIYHLLIKPYAVARFLFGMKPKNETKPVKSTEPVVLKEEILLSA